SRQRFLCTAGEWRFCQKLEEAVGDRFTVMMQVRVGSMLRCDPKDWNTWGRQVAQKSFDFVLVERGTSFAAAAIELDDNTHLLPERRKRDKFLNEACKAADLPLIRIKTAQRYKVGEIRETVKAHLSKGACTLRPGDDPALRDERPPGWVWKRAH
ncbi:MAG: DUF2726 domain-containing protein, partial [Planctomycetota bacterium]